MEQHLTDPFKKKDKLSVCFIPVSAMVIRLGIFSYGFCVAVLERMVWCLLMLGFEGGISVK